MENRPALKKLPTLAELVSNDDATLRDKENALMVLLNHEPPKDWIKKHPFAKIDYLPIERVEYLLSRIFGKWWVDVKNIQVVANAVVVTVRVNVINPITGESDYQEGVGAAPIQTDKGATAMDLNSVKADAVMKAAPAAKSYAIKDACEHWGKMFGKDLNRKDEISYESLISERWKQQQ